MNMEKSKVEKIERALALCPSLPPDVIEAIEELRREAA